MKLSLALPLRNRYLFASDISLLAIAAYGSYVLRLEKFDLGEQWPGFLLFTGLVLVITPLVFARAGIYSRYWRYASVEEMMLMAGAVTTAVVLVGAASLAIVRLLPFKPPFPRSVPLIFLLLALVATAGPRFALRRLAPSTLRNRSNGKEYDAHSVAVLIMGAGDAGAMIARELKSNPHLGFKPVGFLDDDLRKHYVRIHGIPVLGGRHAIPEMVVRYRASQVIIAMPTVPGVEIRDIVHICNEADVQARIIPGIYELLDGSVSVSQLRDVKIDDLLRREPVQIDTGQVAALIRDKRVLVTGAGGSIGSELCRQIVRCEPAELIILGHGENSIFDIHNELKGLKTRSSKLKTDKPPLWLPGSNNQLPTSRVTPIIADIRDVDRLTAVFAEYQPEIVFHAAAHKHVPLMESNAEDAITNNILGVRNLVEASISSGTSHFVLISTDKAVNPSSVMGATKRVAELIVQDAALRTARAFVAVRFGNVLGSRGSVVPFFQRQIAAGGPVTVTDPEVKRYFMTIPEAVQLVLQAAALGCGGEIFVLDMGAPVRIADLARDLIRLSGLEPDRDIEIRYTGLRPGEKLFEELFGADEAYGRTQHEKVFVYRNGDSAGSAETLAGRRQVAPPVPLLAGQLDALILAAQRGDAAEIRCLLGKLVPEYHALGNR